MLDYIGTITGIIGAVTGCLAYLKTKQVKLLDLRLELRKSIASAHHELSMARSGIDLGARSRRAVLVATGHGNSGNLVAWDQDVRADAAKLDQIAATIRSETADFTALNDKQLESEIVAAHRIAAELTTIVTKYREALAADDDRRREIRQEVADRTNQALAASLKRDTGSTYL